MHGLNLAYQSSSPLTVPCTVPKGTERRYERSDSHSDSEDSHNPHLHCQDQPQRLDIDPEDEANAGLTSQTLNADGTPKRPMNAFMIFARRRRPQVSAENQSMRTGEISKILSKEWNSMEMAEKQFYLDQAKQLKDTFNNKYPDYVYRRRPNNSRKKRRMEGGVIRTADNLLLRDHADDISGSETYGEHSPVDADDGFGEAHMDSHFPRVSTTFGENDCFAPQLGNQSYIYPVPTDIPRRVQPQETRISHLPARRAPDAPTRLQESQHSHVHSQNLAHHAQASTPFPPEQTTGNGNWDSRGGSSHFASSNWPTTQRRQATSSTPRQPPYTAANPSAWSSTPAVSMDTSDNSRPQAANYAFPTLNSPFYPQTSHFEVNHRTTGSPLVTQAVNYNASQSQVQGGMSIEHTSQYDDRNFSSPSVAHYPNAFAQNLGRASHLYQQPQPRPALPRSPPSVQSIASFTPSHSRPMSSPSSSLHSNPASFQLGYWSRDRLE